MTTVDKFQGIKVGNFEHGFDVRYQIAPEQLDVQEIVTNAYIQYQALISMAETLKDRHRQGLPIFVRINTGARAGSIAKIDPAFINTNIPISFNHKTPQLFSDNTIVAVLTTGYDLRINCQLVVKDAIRVKLYQDLTYVFDDRSVKTNFKDQEDLEFLPFYDGPTVFCFTKKPKSESKPDGPPFAHEPIDTFGHKLAIGDMFIHGRSNDLVFGILEGVTPAGVLIYRSLYGKSGQRLASSDLLSCVKAGQASRSLMKFTKGEVLSERLMMEKLAKI